MEESKQGSHLWFGINSLRCSIRDGLGLVKLGAGSLMEVSLHYWAWRREEGRREVGETLKRLNGQSSELEVVSEGADQYKVQSSGWGLGTIGAQEEEQVWG